MVPASSHSLSCYVVESAEGSEMLKTYIDRVVDYVWTVFGLGAFLVSCTAIFVWKIPILFVILLMMGMGTALTGLIVNTKVVTIGGVLGALLSLGCFYMLGIDQILFLHWRSSL